MKIQKKNILLGNNKLLFFFIFFYFLETYVFSDEKKNYLGNFVEIEILDKLSSKNTTLNLKMGNEKIFQNLSIKALKCKNSEFDDDPEITAYLQVKDINSSTNDQVFIFNGWTFSSSPAIQNFDHPVYDIWLTKCYS